MRCVWGGEIILFSTTDNTYGSSACLIDTWTCGHVKLTRQVNLSLVVMHRMPHSKMLLKFQVMFDSVMNVKCFARHSVIALRSKLAVSSWVEWFMKLEICFIILHRTRAFLAPNFFPPEKTEAPFWKLCFYV